MKGYVSFVLASAAILLGLSLMRLQLSWSGFDLSPAIAIERAYGESMNMKETALEAMRQGALGGFGSYDASHDMEGCSHCPESFCSYAMPPPPNFCDAERCGSCFRESDARAAAEKGAEDALGSLSFPDGDFGHSVGGTDTEAFLRHDISGRNGFSLDYLRLRQPLRLGLAPGRLGLSAEASLPEGLVVR